MTTDREKAREILEKRDDARKGIEREDPEDPKGRDPLEAEKKRDEKAGELAGVAIGAGLKRSG
jgi:hypothetical protein